jgi:PIN domain nuclease of toxin-antitoxin system
MDLILDTHVLIWFLDGDEKLSQKAKIAIENSKKSKYIISQQFGN